jgi:CheY-like chemotaxis protein
MTERWERMMFRILLIEDNPRFRETIKVVLSTYFPLIDIAEAGDGHEAMEKIKASFPDLIFSDIKLPGENGINLTRRIKSFYPEIPVIILTTYDMPEYAEATYSAGADYFLTKGSSTGEQLAGLVEEVMLSQKPEPADPSKRMEEAVIINA